MSRLRSRSMGRNRRGSRGKGIYKDDFEKKELTPQQEEYLRCYHKNLKQLEHLESLIKQLRIRWKLLKDRKTLSKIKTKFKVFFEKCDEFEGCLKKFPTKTFIEASGKCEALKKFRKD